MKKEVDLTWFSRSSSINPELLLNDIAMNEWVVGGFNAVSRLVIKCTNDLFFELVKEQAKQMNLGKDIYDARTIGGKFFKRMFRNKEINGTVKTIKIYETEVGVLTLKEVNEES